jgi:hypothetical protein
MGHKVEKEDDLDFFIEVYNGYNLPMRGDDAFIEGEFKEWQNMPKTIEFWAKRPGEQETVEMYQKSQSRLTVKYLRLREKYALLKGVCYERVIRDKKLVNTTDNNNDGDRVEYQINYNQRKVGTLIGAKYMSYKESGSGIKRYYWLVKFSDHTVTYDDNKRELNRKYFVPCDLEAARRARNAAHDDWEATVLKAQVREAAAREALAAREAAAAKTRKGRKQGRRQTRRSRS